MKNSFWKRSYPWHNIYITFPFYRDVRFTLSYISAKSLGLLILQRSHGCELWRILAPVYRLSRSNSSCITPTSADHPRPNYRSGSESEIPLQFPPSAGWISRRTHCRLLSRLWGCMQLLFMATIALVMPGVTAYALVPRSRNRNHNMTYEDWVQLYIHIVDKSRWWWQKLVLFWLVCSCSEYTYLCDKWSNIASKSWLLYYVQFILPF
jgi:hypothetical protein